MNPSLDEVIGTPLSQQLLADMLLMGDRRHPDMATVFARVFGIDGQRRLWQARGDFVLLRTDPMQQPYVIGVSLERDADQLRRSARAGVFGSPMLCAELFCS